mgnify:CR=1 FL=1
MLSPQARPYIEASVPVLRQHGVTITRTFYKNMFAAHPELTNLFNMGNQASGAQQQSLASAVFAYAANIDNPDALAPVVSRIVHKHASLGITAKHYPIVGRHLLGAIQETLDDAATPELLSAWEEAYAMLADAFVSEEQKLYQASNAEPGALHDMRVLDVKQESANVRSFILAPVNATPVPNFQPGQYVSVAVQLENGQRQLRQYSLSDAPGKAHLRISVKREIAGTETPAGMVSNWLHDNVEKGGVLAISPPFGDFTPDTDGSAPIVLLSAGIGITPMVSVLNRIADVASQRKVIFAHAAQEPRYQAHRDDIAKARAIMPNLQVVTFYETLDAQFQGMADVIQGRMKIDQLPAWSFADTNVYMCGPLKFMQAQWRDLIAHGVPPVRLYQEVFGPDLLGHLL